MCNNDFSLCDLSLLFSVRVTGEALTQTAQCLCQLSSGQQQHRSIRPRTSPMFVVHTFVCICPVVRHVPWTVKGNVPPLLWETKLR